MILDVNMVDVIFLKKQDRWYKIELGIDMFGEVVFNRSWGSLKSYGAGRSVKKILLNKKIEKVKDASLRRCHKLGYELS